MMFWAMGQYNLSKSHTSQLWQAIYSFATHYIPNAQTVEGLNYVRNQLWHQMNEQRVDCPVGAATNSSDMIEKILMRIGSSAQKQVFDFSYTLHMDCEACHKSTNIHNSYETFSTAHIGDLTHDTTHLAASLAGVASFVDCSHCDKPGRAHTYRCNIKPNRFTVITNVNCTFDGEFLSKWPVREKYLDKYVLRLTALVVCIRGNHYICACEEKRNDWLLYDDMHGVHRTTLPNIVKLLEWKTSTRVQRPFVETLVYRYAH